MSPDLLGQELRVINVGLEVFAHELAAQGATVVEVGACPSAGQNARLTGQSPQVS